MAKRKSTTTDEPQADLYLCLTQEQRDGYFHIYGRIVTQRYEPGNGHVPYGTDDTYGDGPLYSGLRLTCQGDERSAMRDSEPVYGFDCEYREEFSIGLRKARRMVKQLERIDRGLDKLREKRGYVGSWGEYVGRLAEVLGCKGIASQKTAEAEARCGYRWTWETIGEGVNTANRWVWTWRQQYTKPQGIEATANAALGRQLEAQLAAADSDAGTEGK
jgi:hypothetical protein